jgi:uncharacterized damage-inducible protein DinB
MRSTPATDDWQSRLRQQLLDRVSAADWADLWPSVVGARLELLAAIEGTSDAQAAWRPAEDQWSIEETVRHLLPSSAGVISIIESLSAGRDPLDGTPYDAPADLTAHEVAPDSPFEFAALRAALRDDGITFAGLVAHLPAEPDLERTFPHMYFGPLPARAWFAFQRVHDRAHLRQIQAITADSRFPS